MTTIIATPDALYSDSLMTDTAIAYKCEKLFRIGKAIIGCSGDTVLINGWLDAYRKHRKYKIPKDHPKEDLQLSVLIVNKKGIWLIEEDLAVDKVNEPYMAIGSGSLAAYGALRQQYRVALGQSRCDPEKLSPHNFMYNFKEAIEIAAEADECTRLPMQVMYLNPKRTT